jgi:predicted glycoside hydrolase/deacetylase ChbG (UPF0249 family)
MAGQHAERWLICNADDFGLTRDVTDAIVESHVSGIMTSTTIMANMPAVEYAAKLAHLHPGLGVGIHLNLTHGRPLSSPEKVHLLLNDEGIFLSNADQRKNLLFGSYKTAQATIELEAQIGRILDLGITPTHFDSHHHITGVPCAFRASMAAAARTGIHRARITSISFRRSRTANLLAPKALALNLLSVPKTMVHEWNKIRLRTSGFQTPDDKILPGRVIPAQSDPVEQFINALSSLRPGITEISFHPGHRGSDPNDSDKTAQLRVRDMQVATSTRTMQFIKENGIRLVNFKTAFE